MDLKRCTSFRSPAGKFGATLAETPVASGLRGDVASVVPVRRPAFPTGDDALVGGSAEETEGGKEQDSDGETGAESSLLSGDDPRFETSSSGIKPGAEARDTTLRGVGFVRSDHRGDDGLGVGGLMPAAVRFWMAAWV